MTYDYPGGVRHPAFADGALVVAFGLVALLVDVAPVRQALLVVIPLVLAWGWATLHLPTRVEMDDEALVFRRYGRVHRYAWGDVTRVRVRRFIVQDRVLVRVEPSGAWRGRYWLLDSMRGYDELVGRLEAR